MESPNHFGIVDYCVVGVTVIGSFCIGIYHSFRGNKTSEDYAMGSRSMKPLPVSLSLLATFISANTILGYSGEAYGNGLGLSWIIFGTSLAIVFAAEVVLPVLYPLRLVSPNHYLQIRFGSPWLRRLSMSMTLMSVTVFMGTALYAPTLALAAVTPVSYTTYIWIMGTVVTVYSSFGGLKAVVWADVFQMVLIIVGVVLVTVMAAVDVGGVSRVWEIAEEGGRTAATDISVDPYTRHTVWNVILLSAFYWGSHYSVAHACYQRTCSLPTIKLAKRMLYYNIIGMAVLSCLVFFMGICVYSVYAGCDPYARGLIISKDQIAPYYVNDRLSHLVGVPGIFVAALLSAALSSLSSGVNTLATLLWADFVSHAPCFKGASEFTAATASKIITLCLGGLTIGLAFLASHLGDLIQAAYTIISVMAGPVLGVFMLGMAVPFCNLKGAFAGILSAWVLCLWIVVGGIIYKPRPALLPVSASNCAVFSALNSNMTSLVNSTVETTEAVNNVIVDVDFFTPDTCASLGVSDCVEESTEWGLLNIYLISYTYYPLIGLVTCLTVGILTSLATGYQDPKEVPAELLLVPLRRFFGKKSDDSLSNGVSSLKYNRTATVDTLVLDSVSVDVDISKTDSIRY